MKCMIKDRRTHRPRPVHHRLCKNSAKPRVQLYKHCRQRTCKLASTRRPSTTTYRPNTSVVKSIPKESVSGGIIANRPMQSRRIGAWVTGSWQTVNLYSRIYQLFEQCFYRSTLLSSALRRVEADDKSEL